jgi:hypothetical protein
MRPLQVKFAKLYGLLLDHLFLTRGHDMTASQTILSCPSPCPIVFNPIEVIRTYMLTLIYPLLDCEELIYSNYAERTQGGYEVV